MAIQEIKPQFKASDGKTFDSKDAAQRHDELVLALREYEKAAEKFTKKLAETQRTADGEVFEFNGYQTYYWISPAIYKLPQVVSISSIDRSCEVIQHGDGTVAVRKIDENGQRRDYRIPELYASFKKASLACLKAQEKWIEEQKEFIEADRKKWATQ